MFELHTVDSSLGNSRKGQLPLDKKTGTHKINLYKVSCSHFHHIWAADVQLISPSQNLVKAGSYEITHI